MDEDRQAWDLQHALSVKLLKTEHAVLIIGFLYNQFKVAQRVTIPLAELVEQLDGYLESLNEHESDRYACTAQAYIY